MGIGKQIEEMRREAGWSQYHLGTLLGTNSRTVQNWENEVSMPSLDNLLKLCSVFQTTPNVLLGFSTHAVLVLDDLPREDQAVMKGIYQLLWSKSHRIRR